MVRTAIISLSTLIALMPHPWGVSPIGATALYGGAWFSRREAWLVPLIPFAAVSLVHGVYSVVVLVFVMAGFAAAATVGHALLSRRRSGPRFALAIGGGAVAFFALSNFSVWLAGYYPPTTAGLLDCYLRGLPYLGIAVLGDTAYTALLFGAHRLLSGRLAPVRPA